MSTLLERLRDRAHFVMNEGIESAATALDEAADTIEALTRERDAMAEALRDIANAVRIGAITDVQAWCNLAEACQQTARAALTPADERQQGDAK